MRNVCSILVTIMLAEIAGAVPQFINYQGNLTTSDGLPLDTVVSMSFAIYDSETGGSLLWTETHDSVVVSQGGFSLLLGGVSPLTDVFTSDRWLGIAVGGDQEMVPRYQVVSVAHAYRVGTVGGASGGSISGNVTITGKATVGNGHTNTGTRAFVAGSNNRATGDYSVIGGGGGLAADSNVASGLNSTVSGGKRNYARGDLSHIGGGTSNITDGTSNTIVGGESNHTSGLLTFIGGGQSNQAVGPWNTIAGGVGNIADSGYATVAGGWENRVSHFGGTVSGGVHNYARGAFGTVAGGGGTAADSNVAAGDYSVVSGGAGNYANGFSSTIAGGARHVASGSRATIGGGRSNRARGDFSVVAGGGGISLADSNAANAPYGTVSGGHANYVSGFYGTVAGGNANEAGQNAFVAGGNGNRALGNGSFAAGFSAHADHFGSFVWGTSTLDSTESFGDWTFTARCSNGVHFYTSLTGTGTGVQLAAGGGSWSSLSDSAQKENIRPVNTRDVLQKLAALPVSQWNYKAQDERIRHIGPMAQDFQAAFGMGENNTTITTVDADGVMMAAIQELAKRNQQLQETVAALQKQVHALQGDSRP